MILEVEKLIYKRPIATSAAKPNIRLHSAFFRAFGVFRGSKS